jgi:hypothetical protein
VRYAEARVELRADVWRSFSAGIGYRIIRAGVEDDGDFEADVTLRGAYVVLALTF